MKRRYDISHNQTLEFCDEIQFNKGTNEEDRDVGTLDFLFFGAFHLHRIWGLFDRKSYADFWIGVMEQRNWFYFLLMGILTIFCVLGIKTFFKNLHHNFWWDGYTFLAGFMCYSIYLPL